MTCATESWDWCLPPVFSFFSFWISTWKNYQKGFHFPIFPLLRLSLGFQSFKILTYYFMHLTVRLYRTFIKYLCSEACLFSSSTSSVVCRVGILISTHIKIPSDYPGTSLAESPSLLFRSKKGTKRRNIVVCVKEKNGHTAKKSLLQQN